MKLFSITLSLLLIFIGKLSMASFIANPEALNRFKQKINYTSIIAKLPNDRLGVYLDWENTLLQLMADVPTWEVEDLSTTIGFPSHGETSLSYESDDVRIDLTVHLFSNSSTKEVVDEALAIMSRTSMMDILKEYDEDGPCDVNFYSPSISDTSVTTSAMCVFRNVLIQVDTLSEEVDVRPVIKALHSKMKASIVDVSEVRPFIISCKVSAEEVAVNQNLYVEFILPANKAYLVELLSGYGDNLEYLNEENLRFNFRAKQQGIHEISFSVLDPKTLYTIDVTRTIKVE